MDILILMFASTLAGFIGAILGLGGGIIIVPVLTLYFHIDIRYAIAASLLSIIATSSGAAVAFLKDELTNLRLAVLLELGTVAGAITGFFVSMYIQSNVLFILFGLFLLFSAIMMLRKRDNVEAFENHSWSEKFKLTTGKNYKIAQVPFGLISMYFAGVLSALLGIGSGILKVMAMDSAMRLPIKVSSATSNFMIGVTAVASAGAYFLRGDIKPTLSAPIVVGVLLGAWLGARAMINMKDKAIRYLFVVVLAVVSIQMIAKGIG